MTISPCRSRVVDRCAITILRVAACNPLGDFSGREVPSNRASRYGVGTWNRNWVASIQLLVQVNFRLTVHAQALCQALPAAGLFRDENRPEPNLRAHGLDEQPRLTCLQRLLVARVQSATQII